MIPSARAVFLRDELLPLTFTPLDVPLPAPEPCMSCNVMNTPFRSFKRWALGLWQRLKERPFESEKLPDAPALCPCHIATTPNRHPAATECCCNRISAATISINSQRSSKHSQPASPPSTNAWLDSTSTAITIGI